MQNDEYIFETNIDNPADYIFNWTLSDGQNSNDTLFNAIIQEIYLDTISLYLSIMDTTGCVSTSAYYMLDDSLVPDTIFSHIISNSTVDFMYQNSNNYSLFWDFGDGFTDSTNNPQHIYTINGEYQACLSIFSSCDTITICDSIEINILGVPTNRLINPVEILIVPNPFNEIFQIKFHNPIDTEYSIELLNFLGEVVLKEKHSDKLILDINGEKLLNGIYFLHILNAENQPVLTKKIIKIR